MTTPAPTRRSLRTRNDAQTQRLGGAALFAAVVALLSGAAFLPLYSHPRIWLVAVVGAFLPLAVLTLARRWRLAGPLTLLALIVGFALVVLPVAVAHGLAGGIAGVAKAEVTALAEVVRGWKHILTLSLPLGTYQHVMVPPLAATMVAAALGVALILHGGRSYTLAALPALIPVLAATLLGSANVSEPLPLGPVTLPAPRETLLWAGTIVIVAIWIAVVSGAERRVALRRGRDDDEQVNSAVVRGAAVRAVAAGVTLTLAVLGGTLIAPVLDPDARLVPRDRIDPEVVAREQVSPLATYRRWKQDDSYYDPLFTVSGNQLPERLRLAVLDHFDGVDFTIGPSSQVGRFVRLPSATPNGQTSRVRIEIDAGYHDIWVPLAELGSPPEFFGERAADLEDAFFLNHELGSALAVPTPEGLERGDGFEALMSIEAAPTLTAAPLATDPLLELADYPYLSQWLGLQDLPPGPNGLLSAIERLRERGYLSHALTEGDGSPAWLEALAQQVPVTFIPSTGGHSTSRIEDLFEQLVEQQLLAPPEAGDAELVAGIGDDEQFAAAAALVARALGYDSRVVLGVKLGAKEGGETPIPMCTSQCEGRHMTAWVEVQGDDDQWVPIPVTPQAATPPTLTQRGEQLPEHATQVQERDAVEADPPAGETDTEGSSDPDQEEQQEEAESGLRAAALTLAAVIFMLLPWLFILLVKRVRTWRRRRQAAPELAVISAWNELTDRYLDSGHLVTVSAARADVAEDLGWHRAEEIAAGVNQAVFAPEGVDEQMAKEFWGIVTAEIKDHRQRSGFWARVRARFSLRSLGLARGRRRRRG